MSYGLRIVYYARRRQAANWPAKIVKPTGCGEKISSAAGRILISATSPLPLSIQMVLSIQVGGVLNDPADVAAVSEGCRRFAAEQDWAAEPVARGIRLFPAGAQQPLTLQFSKRGELASWSATIETASAHVQIVRLLRRLSPLFRQLSVNDESGYWDEGDEQQLAARMATAVREGDAGHKRPHDTANDAATAGSSSGAVNGTVGDLSPLAPLLAAAENNDVAAQTQIAQRFAQGQGAPLDLLEAVRWLRRAALQGGVTAQYELGLCYAEGRGVAADTTKALQWLQRSAGQHNADAENLLGEIHVENDARQAVKWFRRAAAQRHAAGMYNLGACHYHGFGVKQDATEAFRLFQSSADLQYPPAVDMLGECYQRGAGVAADEFRALACFREAAEQNYSRAQVSLGACYEFGEGVRRCPRQALHWYQAAAAQNDPQGRYCLGVCYESGCGVEIDLQKAEQEYAAAAEGGVPAALARWAHLEHRRQLDCHDPEFLTTIRDRYLQASREDDTFAIVQLGLFFEHFWKPADWASAARCYERAARLGDGRALFLFSQCQSLGRGIAEDREAAVQGWRRAAEMGEAHADVALALAAFQGWGSERDLKECRRRLEASADLFSWPQKDPSEAFQKGAKRLAKGKPVSSRPPATLGDIFEGPAQAGEAWAMHNLALCCEAGHGVALDLRRAEHLFQKAAQLGLAEARFQWGKRTLAAAPLDLPDAQSISSEQRASLESAAGQGYPPAMNCLGEKLLSVGGSNDHERALGLFLDAAELGHPPAMANAAYCFDSGFGVAADPVRALYWYYRAYCQDMPEVASAIRRLERDRGGQFVV